MAVVRELPIEVIAAVVPMTPITASRLLPDYRHNHPPLAPLMVAHHLRQGRIGGHSCAMAVLVGLTGCARRSRPRSNAPVMPAAGSLPRELLQATCLPTSSNRPTSCWWRRSIWFLRRRIRLRSSRRLDHPGAGYSRLPDFRFLRHRARRARQSGPSLWIGSRRRPVARRGRTGIDQHLRLTLKAPSVTVSLSAISGLQSIAGEHLVGPDGTITLGAYGGVYVVGQTLADAKR